MTPDIDVTDLFADPAAVRVGYNPFRDPGFVRLDDRACIEAADLVALDGGAMVAVRVVTPGKGITRPDYASM